MIINTPISLGELIDKISILKIKKKKIQNKKNLILLMRNYLLLESRLFKFIS